MAELADILKAGTRTTVSDNGTNITIDVPSNAFATTAQGALADSAVQPGDDITDLGSGEATDGYVATADGSGGIAWEAPTGGGGGGGSGASTHVAIAANTTLIDAHLGQTLVYAGSDDITITFDDALTDGFQCSVMNVGTGTITFAVEGTDTLTPTSAKLYPGRSGISAAAAAYSGGEAYVIAAEQDIESFVVALGGEDTDMSVGPTKVTLRMPYAFYVTEVRASVSAAPTGSKANFDVNKNGVSILATAVSIDAGEKTSTTAATAAVIGTPLIEDDAELTFDIDQAGSTNPGQGPKVTLLGYRA